MEPRRFPFKLAPLRRAIYEWRERDRPRQHPSEKIALVAGQKASPVIEIGSHRSFQKS